MRATWFALHTSLIRNLNCRSSDADFQTMQQVYSNENISDEDAAKYAG